MFGPLAFEFLWYVVVLEELLATTLTLAQDCELSVVPEWVDRTSVTEVRHEHTDTTRNHKNTTA